MNAEQLFDCITALPDGMVEEAKMHGFRRKSEWKLWTAAAAVTVVVALGLVLSRIALHGMGNSGGGSGGGKDGYSYMEYVGPVLPLTSAKECNDITAARYVDYDFSPYRSRQYTSAGGDTYSRWNSEAVVTDRYVLENRGAADETLTLLYPAELTLGDALDHLPTITVNGEPAEARLYPGFYAGGFEDAWGGNDPAGSLNLANPRCWEDYAALLSDPAYSARAMQAYPVLEQPVTVYRVDNYAVEETDASAPTLRMSFSVDFDRTAVLSWNANGGTNDRENGRCSRSTSGLAWQPRPMYLILSGDDIDGYTLQGFRNGGCNEGEEIGISATVTRYETTLDALLRELLSDWIDQRRGDANSVASVLPFDTLIGAVSDVLARYGALSERPAERYSFGRLEDVFDFFSMRRVMYLRFEMTVPAGGTAEVCAVMHKQASRDYTGKTRNVNGYDLATRLGSTLRFTEQTASVSHTDAVRILENSFGFDPERGVTEAALDLRTEHYWMQVEKR